MSDDELFGGGVEPPRRRSTFTPPPEDAPFPERLGELSDEEIQRAREVTERASQHSATSSPAGPSEREGVPVSPLTPSAPVPPPPLVVPAPPVIPPAPRRQSLSDQEIVARFQSSGSADTSSLMDDLEEQLLLRQQEDNAFRAWSDRVYALLGVDEASHLVERERRAFEGLPPLPEPETEPTPEPAVSQVVVPGVSTDSVTLPSAPSLTSSEPIVLPVWGGEPATPEAISPVGSPVTVSSETPEGSDFDQVLVDPDAVTPPTRAWPLIATDVDSDGEVSEDVETEEDKQEADVFPVLEDAGLAPEREEAPADEPAEILPVAPSLVEGGVVVGTETMSVAKTDTVVPLPEPDETDAIVLHGDKWFSFDRVGVEPTPETQRTHRSLRLFWTWWGATTPVVSVFLGFWLVGSGLNLLQSAVAAGVGLLLATLPLALGTLRGVRTGLPTLVSTRMVFGLFGNLIPTVIMLLVRLVVASATLWLGVWVIAGVIQEANFWTGDPLIIQAAITGVCALSVGALVIAGRRFISLMLLISAGVGSIAVASFVVLTVDWLSREALVQPLATAAPLAAGITLVASVFMVVWAHTGGDIARFQVASSGAAGTSVVSIAALLPPLAIVVWGSLLAASGSNVRQAFNADPFDAVLEGLPGWYPAPALLLAGLPLIAVAALTLHSTTYAVMSTGLSAPRYATATVVSIVVTLLTLSAIVLDVDLPSVAVDGLYFTGVVVAAWTGALLGDVITRRKEPAPSQLLGRGRSFPGWRIAPLVGVLIAMPLGWGMNESGVGWLSWQGYLTPVLETLGLVDLGPWQLGLVVSLVVSLLTTAFAGIRGGVLVAAKKDAE